MSIFASCPLDELVERTLPYLERPAEEGGLPDSITRPLNHDYTTQVLRLEQERMKTLGEAASRIAFFYVDELTYNPAVLIEKGMDTVTYTECSHSCSRSAGWSGVMGCYI